MRKANVTRWVCAMGAGALLLTFSGCAMFQGTRADNLALKEQQMQSFVESIRFRQGDATAHYDLGVHMQARKRHRPAIEAFQAALHSDPAHVAAYNAMGISHDALGEHDRAIAAYKAALAIDATLDYARNNLGYACLLQGKFDAAIEHFTAALALDGDNALYRNNLGLALAKSGRHDEALATFMEGGDAARAHYNMAQLYYRQGQYKAAGEHYRMAAAHNRAASAPEIASGMEAAGALARILEGEKADPAVPVPAETVALQPDVPERAGGGFTVIPASAYSAPQRLRIIQAGRAAVQVQPAPRLLAYKTALPRSDPSQDIRQAVREMLAREVLAKLNEQQAMELLRLRADAAGDGQVRRVRIEVANGNGVRRMANHVGNFLKDRDVGLMYLSNARHFNHEETVIYYAVGYLPEAYRLARRLPGRQRLEEVAEVRGGHAQISVLVGRDLVAHASHFDQL